MRGAHRHIPNLTVSVPVCHNKSNWPKPYPIQTVKDQSHGDAELFKVQIAVIIDIGKIPYALKLVIAQATVLEHGCCLLACEELATACSC